MTEVEEDNHRQTKRIQFILVSTMSHYIGKKPFGLKTNVKKILNLFSRFMSLTYFDVTVFFSYCFVKKIYVAIDIFKSGPTTTRGLRGNTPWPSPQHPLINNVFYRKLNLTVNR